MSFTKYIIFTLLVLIQCLSLTAQNKNFKKAQKCYDEAKYAKAFKTLEKAKKDKVQAKKANTYLLESKILLKLNEEIPDAKTAKDAVKAAIKAKNKSTSTSFVSDNQELYNAVAAINMSEALKYYNEQRYSKAITLFKRSLDLNSDSLSKYLLGVSYIKYNDFRRGMPILDELINEQYEHYLSDSLLSDFMPNAFNVYSDALVKKKLIDSAEFYLKMGLDMYPTDKEMLSKQKVVWYKRSAEIPLSYTLFDFLNKATQTYPFDSAFTFKKNGVYLMFINNNIKAGDKVAKDSWLNKFLNEKKELAQRNPTKRQKKWDYFLEKETTTILEKLLFYYGNYGELEAQKELFYTYSKAKFEGDIGLALKHLEPLFPANIVASIYEQSIEDGYKVLSSQRYAWYKTLLANTDKKESDYEALLAINENITSSSNKAALSGDHKLLLFGYWDKVITTGDYWKAYELGNQANTRYPELAAKFWVNTISNDFKDNYYGTRVLLNTPSSIPFGFSWNGNPSDCSPGSLPDSILIKVARRINYFRRTAGLMDPVALMTNYNQQCQKAALFYTSNNNLTHTLNPDLLCYSYDGATAAKYGLLSQGMHTSIAITEFMNDRSNSAGNRRWMLHPPTKHMGFGCTDKHNVLRCVSENTNWDTTEYRSRGVAWPPQGYSPRMFAFKNWSYSGYQNFEDAKVSLTNLKTQAPISVEVFKTVKGYGMPTLVWAPKELVRLGKESIDIRVDITLKNGKKITYNVNLVNVNL